MSTKIAIFAFICVIIVKVREYMIENLERQGPSELDIYMNKIKIIRDFLKNKRKNK